MSAERRKRSTGDLLLLVAWALAVCVVLVLSAGFSGGFQTLLRNPIAWGLALTVTIPLLKWFDSNSD